MFYRPFGKTDIRVSQLGFGCMRFPLKDENDPKSIDEPVAKKMLYYAIDNGLNYLDTAYGYHSGMSEVFLGNVLKDGYRKKVFLATKLPVYLIKEESDTTKYFNEQLQRLQADYIDMYLLHGIDKKAWKKIQECEILKFLDDAKSSGRIRFCGFSFHDDIELFKTIVDAYPWALCLIHLNYVDIHHQAGIEGLEYAHKKGLAVIIMEPLRGGKLVKRVPQEVLNIIAQSRFLQSPVEFAFRFLYNRPEVTCVLSGMSSMEQVKQNIEFASQNHINTLDNRELELYNQARIVYKSRIKINCTDCGYCMPCPQGIPISFIFELLNDFYIYDATEESRMFYNKFIKPENHADKCTECGQCEEKCPQKIEIVKELKIAHKVLKQ
jgi:predicted aldo/keto reductase-like oxidoreductase